METGKQEPTASLGEVMGEGEMGKGVRSFREY